VFEVFDQFIDEIDFYTRDKQGRYLKAEGEDQQPLEGRQYKHKNFVFNFTFHNKAK